MGNKEAIGVVNVHSIRNRRGVEATLYSDGTYYYGGVYMRYRRGAAIKAPQDAVIPEDNFWKKLTNKFKRKNK